jgi:hypothetical protein
MSGNVNVHVNVRVRIGMHRITSVKAFEEDEDLDSLPKKKSHGTNVKSADWSLTIDMVWTIP